MFNVGDKVVYPMHGAGTIVSIEEKEMLNDINNYYIIKMPVDGMKLMVPTKNADAIGLREISDKNISEQVYKVLEKPKEPYVHDANWSKRYHLNVEKIKSGDILEVAEVVRDLSHRHMERGLSIGEKNMLAKAKDILISEMVLSQDMSHDVIDNKIEEIIKESYEAGLNTEMDSKGILNESDDNNDSGDNVIRLD